MTLSTAIPGAKTRRGRIVSVDVKFADTLAGWLAEAGMKVLHRDGYHYGVEGAAGMGRVKRETVRRFLTQFVEERTGCEVAADLTPTIIRAAGVCEVEEHKVEVAELLETTAGAWVAQNIKPGHGWVSCAEICARMGISSARGGVSDTIKQAMTLLYGAEQDRRTVNGVRVWGYSGVQFLEQAAVSAPVGVDSPAETVEQARDASHIPQINTIGAAAPVVSFFMKGTPTT